MNNKGDSLIIKAISDYRNVYRLLTFFDSYICTAHHILYNLKEKFLKATAE